MTYSPYAAECFAALAWGIPIPVWWSFDKDSRATMVATLEKRNALRYGG